VADKNNVRLHYALATNKQNKQGAVPGGKAVAGGASVKNAR
jgi:hypothetical protein